MLSRLKYPHAFALLFLLLPLSLSAQTTLDANFSSAYGWVKPGETYPFSVSYKASPSGASSASITVSLPLEAVFVSSSPAPSTASPLTYNLGALAPNATGRILIHVRAMNLNEDPEIIWKDLSATATFTSTLLGISQPAVSSRTLGPKVTTQSSARFGVRPFPLVMVHYQDIRRCKGEGDPFPECTGNHTAEALDEAVNSRTTGRSLWQLYNDMSFGQIEPRGSVRPAPGSTTRAFDPLYNHKFSSLTPSGTCSGVTFGPAKATPVYPNRIEEGWYVLPGTQGYYGSDKTGHALAGAVTGQGLLFGVDDACGPTGKIVYDAASLADPDLDYNEFDTDKDGVVDFFNVAYAGDGGNGSLTPTGLNNVWPHKSDLRYYFSDENKLTGYVSNDQLKTHAGEPLYYTDSTRSQMTTSSASGLKVFVRVGPYNVNPEAAIEKMSVIAHEYGHSLGLPDFYSTGGRETFGSWELMASDHAQFMSVFTRQEMGWIVPLDAKDDIYTLRESKTDTKTIQWKRPDGTPYTLTGPNIHNADALRIALPTVKLIDSVPSGTRAWHSGAGNDFGCPGHTLDVFLPDLQQHASASSVTLKFRTLYEIEWDWDYAFVLASSDGGQTWTSLPSKKGTTLSGFNPNNAECYTRYQNGITGVSGLPNSLTTIERTTSAYPAAQWIEDEFDLTAFKGSNVLLRFSYFTDAALTKRGWFIDDISVTADNTTVYTSDFEQEEGTRLFPTAWSRVSTADGVDVDHSYYVELRDRTSWDLDGKLQSDRGNPTWQPGLAVLYTDENHGYGNTGVDNPPAQTIIDSRPEPGNDTPGLDDAAFTTADGRNKFDGCKHIDNYDTPTGLWKLPAGVTLRIQDVSGLSADGAPSAATARVAVDIAPDCNVVEAPPVLSFAAGHQDPDTDGSVDLTWTRPAGAAGPDDVQEATVYTNLLSDDAEAGLGNWTAATSDATMPGWSQSRLRHHSGEFSFGSIATDAARNASSTLTLNAPISVPSAGSTKLTFYDGFAGEIDDLGFVEVSEDGTTWEAVYQIANPTFADENVTALEAPLAQQSVNLTPYAGKTLRLRFRYFVGASNYIAYAPVGWNVDDVKIETANWYDVASVSGTSYSRRPGNGTFFYRVRTRYQAGTVTTPGEWSNVITTAVNAPPPPVKKADLVVGAIHVASQKGKNKGIYITTSVLNVGEASAPASQTEITIDGVVIATVATPALAQGGLVEITVQWNAQGHDGQHQVQVTSDKGAAVTESSEGNNTRSASFTTQGGKL